MIKRLKLLTSVRNMEKNWVCIVKDPSVRELKFAKLASQGPTEGEGHDVVEIEEIEKEALFRKMEVAVKDLKERKDYILGVQKNAEKENMESIKKITARKEELIQKINQRHEEMVAEMRQKGQNCFHWKIKNYRGTFRLLKNIKDNVDKEVITRQEIKVEMQKVTSVEQSIEDQLSSNVEYKLLKFEEVKSTSADVERLCGDLQESTKFSD